MLKNQNLQKEFELNGFVKFDFLSPIELGRLKDLYMKYEMFHTFSGKYHHSTFHIGNEELARKVDKEIQDILRNPIEEHFVNYNLFVANFMVKEAHEDSEVVPHQDWTYVDESKYQSLNIWIPLQDVGVHNGCMTFLPKSHNIRPTLRTSPSFVSLFDKVMHLVRENMVSVEMREGQAVLFSHATLHGSVPNHSDKRRVNVVQGIYSKEAQLQHSFLREEDNNSIRVYNITVNDFYKLEDLVEPTFLKFKEEINFDFPVLSMEEFYQYYPKLGKNLWNRIKSTFK